jgi:uncharacterized protein (TIGR02217 family)
MTSFHEVQFPSDVSRGASGGPGYSTTVVAWCRDTRSAPCKLPGATGRRREGLWNVAHGLKTRDQVAWLTAFFRARKGKAARGYSFFRFKDWTDYQGAGQPLGVGNGATKTFQLT